MKRILETDWQIYCDVGSNHNQSLERAQAIIRKVAMLNGVVGHHFAGVKFQLFQASMLWAPSPHSPDEGVVKGRELPVDWIPELIATGKQEGIQIGFTAFSETGLDHLKDYAASLFFKVSSFDLLRLEFIRRNAELALTSCRPLHISTGSSCIEEVEAALDRVARVAPGLPVYLYHCVSEYPCHPTLARMPDMIRLDILARKYHNSIPITLGWSDHTRNPGVICRSFATGAKVVELHVDLDDCAGAETKHGHCWTISDLMDLGSILQGYHACYSRDWPAERPDLRADPSDGLRPLKKYRKKSSEIGDD